MKWAEGDILEHAKTNTGTALAFTANSMLVHNKLNMGGGAAKDVRDEYPGVDAAFFEILSEGVNDNCVLSDYHLCAVETEGRTIIAVQVKRDTREKATPNAKRAWYELARRSLEHLAVWQEATGTPVVINCPLIGLGGFSTYPEFMQVKLMVDMTLGDADITVLTLPGDVAKMRDEFRAARGQ